MNLIFSSSELKKINLAIVQNQSEIQTTLDLGITETKIKLSKNGFYYQNLLVTVPKLRDEDHSCYILNKNQLVKVQWFSQKTKQMYKLVPTSNKPILQISGTSMHKFQFVERIKKDKLTGNILDAGTGLGYTAIGVSETADFVTTVEFDSNVIKMQKINPYSRELFDKQKINQIKQFKEDIVKLINKFFDFQFDYIIFDAGTPKSSGNFFSLDNYRQAFRVLKSKGKLYHYLPKHLINHGRDFGAEVIDRMKRAGFHLVERQIEDSYVIMKKN
jgi:predicted methyltransferase